MKIVPKSAPGPTWPPKAVFEPISVQFWLQLGAVLGGKMGSCWGHVGQKIDSWRILKAFKIDQDFQHLSGPSWDRFWSGLGAQNRTKNWSKIGLKSDQDEHVKVFKTFGGADVFEDAGKSKINQKQTKNRLQSHLKLRFHKSNQKCHK